jgi:hypothetical protein
MPFSAMWKPHGCEGSAQRHLSGLKHPLFPALRKRYIRAALMEINKKSPFFPHSGDRRIDAPGNCAGAMNFAASHGIGSAPREHRP